MLNFSNGDLKMSFSLFSSAGVKCLKITKIDYYFLFIFKCSLKINAFFAGSLQLFLIIITNAYECTIAMCSACICLLIYYVHCRTIFTHSRHVESQTIFYFNCVWFFYFCSHRHRLHFAAICGITVRIMNETVELDCCKRPIV